MAVTWGKSLNYFGYVMVAIAATAVTVPFIWPNSEFVCILERFQTLITGAIAGVAALIAAWIVYRAAKLPIDEDKKHAQAMRAAGAAVITNAVNTMYMSILHKTGMPTNMRDGRLVVPGALPSLELINTQDHDTVEELSKFIDLASRIDVYVNVAHPVESAIDDEEREFVEGKLDEIKTVMSSLKEKLEITAKVRAT